MMYRPSDWLDGFLSTYCYRLRYGLEIRVPWPKWYPEVMLETGGAYGPMDLNDVRRLEKLK